MGVRRGNVAAGTGDEFPDRNPGVAFRRPADRGKHHRGVRGGEERAAPLFRSRARVGFQPRKVHIKLDGREEHVVADTDFV